MLGDRQPEKDRDPRRYRVGRRPAAMLECVAEDLKKIESINRYDDLTSKFILLMIQHVTPRVLD